MSSIKFNHLTREIEMKGSGSFIESNFNKIQDLLVESFGAKEKMISRRTKETQEPISIVKKDEPQASAEVRKPKLSEALPTLPVTESFIPEISHELKANRPPLRKYMSIGIEN